MQRNVLKNFFVYKLSNPKPIFEGNSEIFL